MRPIRFAPPIIDPTQVDVLRRLDDRMAAIADLPDPAEALVELNVAIEAAVQVGHALPFVQALEAQNLPWMGGGAAAEIAAADLRIQLMAAARDALDITPGPDETGLARAIHYDLLIARTALLLIAHAPNGQTDAATLGALATSLFAVMNWDRTLDDSERDPFVTAEEWGAAERILASLGPLQSRLVDAHRAFFELGATIDDALGPWFARPLGLRPEMTWTEAVDQLVTESRARGKAEPCVRRDDRNVTVSELLEEASRLLVLPNRPLADQVNAVAPLLEALKDLDLPLDKPYRLLDAAFHRLSVLSVRWGSPEVVL